jgi:hypothetical protein
MPLVATLLALMLLGCGGRTTMDQDATGKYDAGSDAGLGALIEEDRRAFCQKDVDCGMAASVDDCVATSTTVSFRCTIGAAAVRDCLDALALQDCQEYSMSSGGSCVPLHKSLDGC